MLGTQRKKSFVNYFYKKMFTSFFMNRTKENLYVHIQPFPESSLKLTSSLPVGGLQNPFLSFYEKWN